jgi:hypothetical protein
MASDQQALHDLITVLCAPGLVLSQSDGQISASGAQGWYSREIRALRRLEITLEGASIVPVGVRARTATATVHSVITGLADLIADPRVLLSRERAVTPATLTDRVRLTNHGPKTVSLRLRARVDSDLAGIDAVRGGRPVSPVPPLWHGDQLRWEGENVTISLRYAPAPDESGLTGETAELRWRVDLPPGESWSLELAATSAHGPVPAFAPTAPANRPQWTNQPHELARANLADLEGLLLADPEAPDDRFAAAGAPWYLTLFGRDALWTARMLLPLDRSLAAGTLRALARRQGTRHDPEAEEAPGKILHEARPAPQRFGELRLPAIYYGTIDATALWVCLLHDAWQAGLPEAEVAALLPNLAAAMDWITGADADPDGDGLIEYAGSAGGRLANQGWKDSADAIRHLDGRYAQGPVALCEVQAYAYAAAVGAATLAGAFGLAAGSAWLSWAARLREEFHRTFWLRDEVGPYPAIGLDAAKHPVSGAASNMGHLLGTGLLDADQARAVADRLAAPDLRTEFGLRTLTTRSAAYNPLSYHCGSVWPHDTAIAIMGLVAEGHAELAGTLASGLLRAASRFGGRPPELYGVMADGTLAHYPSACRPQAWAAAAIIVAARTVEPAAAAWASEHR